MRRLLPFAFAAIAFAGCHKKDDPVTNIKAATGKLKFEFSNVVGNQPLVLNTNWYRNAAGDSFQVSMYKYYVSNVTLTTDDGKTYTEPDSYHLIDQSKTETLRFELDSLPAGNYTSVHFLIGVDSAANTSGPRTGALDPVNGMIWDWNTGYVMAKMEGKSPQTRNNFFEYHIAGFSGVNSVLRTLTLPFPEAAKVSATTGPNVHLFSDVAQWFYAPQNISISTYSDVSTVGSDAAMIATNYADMFHVDHIDN